MPTPVNFAHGTVGAGVTSLSGTVTTATSVHDKALIGVSVGGSSSPTVSAITDTKGNKYTLVLSFTTSAPYLYVYEVTYTTALTTSDTINLTFSASTVHDASLSGTNLGAVLGLDVAALANGTSTAPSVSATPVYPGDEAIAIFAWSNAAGAGTVGSGYTQLDQQHPSSGAYLTTAYDLTTTAGAAQTAGYTVVSAAWRGIIVTVITQPWYFTNSSFITNLDTSNHTVASAAFNVAGAMSITADTGLGSGGAPSAPGSLPSGYTTTPILKYTAYAQFATDIAAANIPSGYAWVAYDNEYEDDGAGGNNWPTPMTEANDPWTYMQNFVTLAHAHGYKVMLMPARDLAHNNSLVNPALGGETDDTWYVRTNIAATAAGTGAEIVHIQDQANQGTTEYLTFWNSTFNQAVAASGKSPFLQVTVGVSTTNPSGVTAAQMTSSAQSVTPPAAGYWLNMSSATAAMGITFLQNMAAGAFNGGGLTLKHASFTGSGTLAGGAVSATGSASHKKATVSASGTITSVATNLPQFIAPRPDYILEAAFFNTDDGPVWSNITDYVELQEGLKCGKRRQTVFDDVAPATFTCSLDNSFGVFNNDKSTSSFAGNVVLNVPIRFRMRWPNVPSSTTNLLNDLQSKSTDADYFTVDQGTIDTDDTVAPTTLDDNNADSFAGGWSTRTDAQDYGGTCQECNVTTAVATFTFTGTKITWIGEKNVDHGIASVSIDGATATLVDCYSASRTYQNSLYVASGLSNGTHVITITVNGTKNASATGFWISVDAFIVETVSSPPTGQTNDIVWNTGVVDKTGAGVWTGNNPTRVPDDHPIYVTPGLPYAAQAKVKDNTAGTGITFKVSGRLRWFDQMGGLISETVGSQVTLTTSYQNVAVNATAPANAATVRFGVVNETLVGPVSRAIYLDGWDQRRQNGATSNYITIPSSADVGSYAQAWIRVSNKTATITAPVGGGWSLVNSWADQYGKTYFYTKFLTAADINKNYTWTSSVKMRWYNFLVCHGGINPTTPINVSAETTEATYRATHTTPNVTTTVANCWIESAVFDVSSTTSLWTAPISENIRVTGYCTGGSAPTGIITDDGTPRAVGTYGNKVFTANSSSKYATMHTLALNPATTTGPNNVAVQISEWQLVQASSVGAWQAGGHWESKFTGLADSWTERFTGELVLMDLAATDRQKILNTITIGSATFESIQQLNPLAYYQLNEGSPEIGTYQEAANSADVSQPTLKRVQWGTGGALNWGQGVGPAVDGSAALITAPVNATNGVGLRTLLSSPIAGADAITLLCWWNSTATGTGSNFTIMKIQDATNGLHPKASMELRYSPGANLNAFGWISSDTYDIQVAANGSGSYGDGHTHLVAATFQLVGGNFQIDLYIDGALAVTNFAATSVNQFQPLAMLSVANAGSSANLHAATFSHAALYSVALDSSSIADIYNAGTTAFAGDTIDQRIGRLAQWEGQQGLALDQSTTVVDRHMPDPQTLLDAIRQASRSEGGTTYIDGEGNIAFLSRQDKEDTGTPLITVPAQQVDPSLQKVTDDALLVNKPVINRLATGVSTTVSDLISQAKNGVYEKDVDTILKNDQDAINYATYLMAFYSSPQARCDTLTLEAMLLQDWANVLKIDMWQLVRITDLPDTEQDDTIDLFIEGWEFDLDQNSFNITFDTSVAIPFAILGDPSRGVCGSAVVGW